MDDKLSMSLDSIIKTARKKSGGGGGKSNNNNNHKNKKKNERRDFDRRGRNRNQNQRNHRGRQHNQQQRRHHQQQRHHQQRFQNRGRQQQRKPRKMDPVKLAVFIHENQIFGQVGKTHLFKFEKWSGEITLNSGGYQNSRNRKALNTILVHVGLNVDFIKGDWIVGNGKGWEVPFTDGVKIGSASKAESIARFRNLFYTFKLGGKDASNPLIVEIPMDEKTGASTTTTTSTTSTQGGKFQNHGRSGRRAFKKPY